MGFWRAAGGAVMVAVTVQPKSRRPGILGRASDIDGTRLRIGVTEPPEDGRANRAVCAALSQALAVPAGSVSVALGHTSRKKTLRIDGDCALITPRLEALCPPV